MSDRRESAGRGSGLQRHQLRGLSPLEAGHKLLRRQSVTDAKRKIERYRKHGDAESLDRFVASWRGHAGHADSYNLIRSLELGDTP